MGDDEEEIKSHEPYISAAEDVNNSTSIKVYQRNQMDENEE